MPELRISGFRVEDLSPVFYKVYLIQKHDEASTLYPKTLDPEPSYLISLIQKHDEARAKPPGPTQHARNHHRRVLPLHRLPLHNHDLDGGEIVRHSREPSSVVARVTPPREVVDSERTRRAFEAEAFHLPRCEEGLEPRASSLLTWDEKILLRTGDNDLPLHDIGFEPRVLGVRFGLKDMVGQQPAAWRYTAGNRSWFPVQTAH